MRRAFGCRRQDGSSYLHDSVDADGSSLDSVRASRATEQVPSLDDDRPVRSEGDRPRTATEHDLLLRIDDQAPAGNMQVLRGLQRCGGRARSRLPGGRTKESDDDRQGGVAVLEDEEHGAARDGSVGYVNDGARSERAALVTGGVDRRLPSVPQAGRPSPGNPRGDSPPPTPWPAA